MSRAVWKGPFVDPSLIKKVEKLKNQTNKTPIKTVSISQARKPVYQSSVNSNSNYENYLSEMFDLL